MSKLVLLLIVAMGLCNMALGETALKPYAPFDEPKPRIPREITEDKRLDVKVNVFVKSKNFRDLFAEITKQTGVKLTTEREIACERAIIYFHARPLRDVMTEVSGLFGYYWLPKGKEGEYSYELREDSRHAKRREEVKQMIKEQQDSILLDIADRCIKDDRFFDRLAEKDPSTGFRMMTDHLKDASKFFAGIGPDGIKDVLAAGQIRCKGSDLSPAWQSALSDWRSSVINRMNTQYQDQNLEPLEPFTPENLALTDFSLTRASSKLMMPSFGISVMTQQPNGSSRGSVFRWPFRRLSEDDARALTGHELPKKVIADKPLSDDPKITADKQRLHVNRRGVILGDALCAIAEQTGFDILADYYFQEDLLQPFQAQPFNTAVSRICDGLGYSCKVGNHALEFRFNEWYDQDIGDEPPAELLNRWWSTVEQKGRLDFNDVLEVGSLPDAQLKWPGLRFIPGARDARSMPLTLRLRRSLDSTRFEKACKEGGLSIAQLSDEQRRALDSWAQAMKIETSPEQMEQAVLKITTYISTPETAADDEGYSYQNFRLVLSAEQIFTSMILIPSPMKESDRKDLVAQRKADLEADKVEVVK